MNNIFIILIGSINTCQFQVCSGVFQRQHHFACLKEAVFMNKHGCASGLGIKSRMINFAFPVFMYPPNISIKKKCYADIKL